MKRINILEKQYKLLAKRKNILESQMMLINEEPNVAGTDEPYYKDPDTGFVISGENNDPDACPFGYFQYKYGSNDLKLFTCWDCEDAIDSDSLLHGDIAREVTYIIVHDLMYRIIIPHEEEILRSLYDLINKGFVNEHNFCDMVRKAFSDAGVDYEPNDDFISFLKEDIKGYEWSELLEYGGLFEDVYSHIGDAYYEYDDYYAYGSVFGVDTNEIIHNSILLGRVWVDKGLITFYPGQQPSRDEMKYLLKDLSKNIRVEYDKFLDFYIIFETGGRNGYKGNGYHGDPTAEIKCCKVSEYIEGKYNGFNRDEEIEMVKNRKGVEKLNIHLAKPEDKRKFLKNFRDTRAEALYAPITKALGTIARYNALKNMYGENRNLKRVNILESQLMLLTEASLEDIYSKYYSDIPWEMFNEIINLDPTASNGRMGRYGKWLLNIYKKGTFKEGDFGEARELLPVYDKYRNVIEVKDIMKLNSMGELYQVVQPYIGGDKATSKSDAARKIKNGAEKVYEDNQWVIVIPHTMEAAQLYGKHTRWCTAAERSDNMFDHYNDKGPLYVNIDKVNDRKYQFHFQSPLSEGFMDEMDKPLYDKVSKNESIADYIGMTDGAKEYYARTIGKKSGIIVLSETEDLQQANMLFNRSDGSVIDAIDAFDSVTEPYHNLELMKENIGENANKYGTYIVSKHGKKNAINGGRVVSDKWFDYVTLESKNIIEVVDGLTWNSRRRRLMFINDGTYVLGNKVWQSSSHVSHDEKFISADGELFMRTNDGHYAPITEGNIESVNYRSMNYEKAAYIECSSFDSGSYFDIFVSKNDGTVITVDTLGKEFIDFIEKNCLEIIYDYESGNQTGTKEHPYNVIIPMFEEDVLNCDGYKLSSTNMRRIMQNSYINWLHYAEDYGGLLGNDEE